jgi:hypothetical protein
MGYLDKGVLDLDIQDDHERALVENVLEQTGQVTWSFSRFDEGEWQEKIAEPRTERWLWFVVANILYPMGYQADLGIKRGRRADDGVAVRRGLRVRPVSVVDLSRSERIETKHPFIGTVCEEAVGSPSNRGGTMTTLMDTVRIEAPTRSPVRPASPLDPSWDDGSEIPSSERSVQDRSRSTQWDRLAMGRGQSLWSEAA